MRGGFIEVALLWHAPLLLLDPATEPGFARTGFSLQYFVQGYIEECNRSASHQVMANIANICQNC